MRSPLWTIMEAWEKEEKHTSGSWLGSKEDEHRIVYSAGKGPETMRGGGGGPTIEEDGPEMAPEHVEDAAYQGPQDEYD